jgi:NAD-dependent SIR2 family protein deacetylase
VLLTGAGISVNAGIPDFRTPGTGLYSKLAEYDLPTPESVFEINYFKSNPKPFYKLAQQLGPQKDIRYVPTFTHYFIKLLEEQGLLFLNLTQNIDGLEIDAGVDPELVMMAHGNFLSAHCSKCKISTDIQLVVGMMDFLCFF